MYWFILNQAFEHLLNTIASGNGPASFDMDGFTEKYLEKAKHSCEKAIFLYTDAAQLKVLPFFKPDERLLIILEKLSLTESMIRRLAVHCSNLSATKDLIDEDELETNQKEWMSLKEAIINANSREEVPAIPAEGEGMMYLQKKARGRKRLAYWLHYIQVSLQKQDSELNDLAQQRWVC